jgi:PAS domain-containing protein
LRLETRLTGPSLLVDHGIISGMSVMIREQERPWGVLGAHTRSRREFTSDDVNFLSGAAYILSTALDRHAAEQKINLLASAIRQTGESILITDAEGNLEYVNPGFEQTSGYSSEEVLGKNPRLLKSGRSSSEFYENLWDTITHRD